MDFRDVTIVNPFQVPVAFLIAIALASSLAPARCQAEVLLGFRLSSILMPNGCQIDFISLSARNPRLTSI